MSVERVNLGAGWVADFDTDRPEALVEKITHSSRKMIVEYNPPFMKRLHHQTRTPVTNRFNRLPPVIEEVLRQHFEARWGGHAA